MPWWRRDASLWCRSSLRRCSRRALGKDEFVLRTRGFSASKPSSAQHNDEEGKRPPGLSDAEWMQLQSFRGWKRGLIDDAYGALFGASNDRLKGKGSGPKAWQTLYGPFPKVLKDIFEPEQDKKPAKFERPENYDKYRPKEPYKYPPPSQPSSTGAHPNEANMNDAAQMKNKFRASGFERTESASGVISPSDPRRPHRAEIKGSEGTKPVETKTWSYSTDQLILDEASANESATAHKEGESLETTSVEQAHMKSPIVKSATHGNTTDWRQTVLDRRLVPKAVTIPREAHIKDVEPTSSDPVHADLRKPPPPKNVHEQSVEIIDAAHNQPLDSTVSRPPHRSTADVLSQLPKDDIDLLTADQIRASMRVKKQTLIRTDQKEPSRAELESSFKDAHSPDLELHPTVQAKIKNDQHMRRAVRKPEAQAKTSTHLSEQKDDQTDTEKKRTETQPAVKVQSKLSPTKEPHEEFSTSRPSTDQRMEAAYEMWEQNTFKPPKPDFWSDAFRLRALGLPTRSQCQELIVDIEKNRHTLKPLESEIIKALPASHWLLEHLTGVEKSLLWWFQHMLEEPSEDSPGRDAEPDDDFAERMLQAKEMETRKVRREYQEAYRALDTMTMDAMLGIPVPLFEDSLKIMQENATRTRKKIVCIEEVGKNMWAQTAQHRGARLNFRAVLDQLPVYRDTQALVIDLVQRMLQVVAVRKTAPAEATTKVEPEDKSASKQDVKAETKPKAKAHNFAPPIPGLATFDESPAPPNAPQQPSPHTSVLNDKLSQEIQAQKTSMQNLSDDGYARPPKSASPSAQFLPSEETKALVNSLFRPFGSQLANLRHETEMVKESATDKPSRDRAHDRELVREIREAYENAYGTITVEHQQGDAQRENDDSKMVKDGEGVAEKAPMRPMVRNEEGISDSSSAGYGSPMLSQLPKQAPTPKTGNSRASSPITANASSTPSKPELAPVSANEKPHMQDQTREALKPHPLDTTPSPKPTTSHSPSPAPPSRGAPSIKQHETQLDARSPGTALYDQYLLTLAHRLAFLRPGTSLHKEYDSLIERYTPPGYTPDRHLQRKHEAPVKRDSWNGGLPPGWRRETREKGMEETGAVAADAEKRGIGKMKVEREAPESLNPAPEIPNSPAQPTTSQPPPPPSLPSPPSRSIKPDIAKAEPEAELKNSYVKPDAPLHDLYLSWLAHRQRGPVPDTQLYRKVRAFRMGVRRCGGGVGRFRGEAGKGGKGGEDMRGMRGKVGTIGVSEALKSAQESLALESVAPETSAVETPRVETSAPETSAPETSAFKTSAPPTPNSSAPAKEKLTPTQPQSQTHKILSYSAQEKRMHVITTTSTSTSSASSSCPSSDTTRKSAIPFHVALSELAYPEKYVAHIPADFEIESVNPDTGTLVLRQRRESEAEGLNEGIVVEVMELAENDNASKEKDVGEAQKKESREKQDQQLERCLQEAEILEVEKDIQKYGFHSGQDEENMEIRELKKLVQKYRSRDRGHINPIDGTTSLSPTGFVGVEPELRVVENEDELEDLDGRKREYCDYWGKREDETRRKSKQSESKNENGDGWQGERSEGREKKWRKGPMGVLRTGILAGAACYVIGVVGEVLR